MSGRLHISNTWAKGSVSGAFRFLWGGGDSSYDKINEQFGSSDVTIDVSFKHVLAFAAGPLQVETFVGDKKYPGWFSSAALNYAYQNKGNDVWPVDGAASWASTFGDNGNLQRFATNLVVGDEMTMTMGSSATFSASDREKILAQASSGFWPFFTASSSSGFESSVTFNDQGKMVATAQSPAGSPLILGVSVSPIDNIFG